jgi:hypothetical protein
MGYQDGPLNINLFSDEVSIRAKRPEHRIYRRSAVYRPDCHSMDLRPTPALHPPRITAGRRNKKAAPACERPYVVRSANLRPPPWRAGQPPRISGASSPSDICKRLLHQRQRAHNRRDLAAPMSPRRQRGAIGRGLFANQTLTLSCWLPSIAVTSRAFRTSASL